MNRYRGLQVCAANGAMSREKLAKLAEVVRELFADPVQAAWYSSFVRCALALRKRDALPKDSPHYFAANAELSRAANATRQYARAHGLRPDTRSGVMAEVRAVLDTLD
jgi:hypothetical protein